MSEKKPVRAHQFGCIVEGDTVDDVVRELRHFVSLLEQGEVATAGCAGGVASGSMFAYRHDPNMTHDEYFDRIDAFLKGE